MNLHNAPITAAELEAVYEAERRPSDPDLKTLQQHAARYALLLGQARAVRARLDKPADAHIPAPDHWPSHVAQVHPARAQCAPVTHLRRRTDVVIDFKRLAAGDAPEPDDATSHPARA